MVVAVLVIIGALLLLGIMLWDAFETIILPRRVQRRFRWARIMTRLTWVPLRHLARRIGPERRREALLAYYGPLSLLLLLASWAVGIIFSYALLQWATGSTLAAPDKQTGFGIDLYLSGTTFFTLGLGDVIPLSSIARLLAVLEAGTGFGLLALVIGYFPTLYQSFSRREVSISLLDARAGSPPTAITLLRRNCQDDHGELMQFLRDWERWSAELLESHLSYPLLAYFRSQHDHQSWLAALTMILDTCTLVLVGIEGIPQQQARLTYAMAIHAAIDLSQVFGVLPVPQLASVDRLDKRGVLQVHQALHTANVVLKTGPSADKRFADLRHRYEPYVLALSNWLLFPLPAWLPTPDRKDDWETSTREHETVLASS